MYSLLGIMTLVVLIYVLHVIWVAESIHTWTYAICVRTYVFCMRWWNIRSIPFFVDAILIYKRIGPRTHTHTHIHILETDHIQQPTANTPGAIHLMQYKCWFSFFFVSRYTDKGICTHIAPATHTQLDITFAWSDFECLSDCGSIYDLTCWIHLSFERWRKHAACIILNGAAKRKPIRLWLHQFAYNQGNRGVLCSRFDIGNCSDTCWNPYIINSSLAAFTCMYHVYYVDVHESTSIHESTFSFTIANACMRLCVCALENISIYGSTDSQLPR